MRKKICAQCRRKKPMKDFYPILRSRSKAVSKRCKECSIKNSQRRKEDARRK